MINFQSAKIFSLFPGIVAGFSRDTFNEPEATNLGFKKLVTQHQVHGSTINETEPGQIPQTGDALITQAPGWLIGVLVADCAAVLIYDPKKQIVAVIHSGWKGSQVEIVPKTIAHLNRQHDSQPLDLRVYVSPLAQKCCYEVQADFVGKFDAKYLDRRHDKLYFDNQAVIRDQLIGSSIPALQTELDPRCTIHDASLRSYRRDGEKAGRMLVGIGLKLS
jgi:polyphenol oxidase